MPRWAKAGVVLIGVAVVVAMVYPVFMRERDGQSPNRQCLSNVKNLTMAVMMYVIDYDRVPDARLWCDQLVDYLRNPDIYRCPQAEQLRCGYALNAGAQHATGGAMRSPEGAKLVTILESDRGWNAHGGPELLPDEPRHLGGDNYGFLDGHAKWAKRGEASAAMAWKARPAGRKPAREGAGK